MDYVRNSYQKFNNTIHAQSNYPTVQTPSFRGSLETPPDTFTPSTQLQSKKEGMSTGAKIALGIGGTLATFLTGLTLVATHQTNKLNKLYNQKMVLASLPEKLEFREAKTVEEGIKFAKEVLGIKNVDKNFTLEAINFANRGIVDVSNANKGRLFIPQNLRYQNENFAAAVKNDIRSANFGDMIISSKTFDEKAINEWLNTALGIGEKETQKVVKPNKEKTNELLTKITYTIDDSIKELARKYRENPNSLSLTEKRELKHNLFKILEQKNIIFNLSPYTSLKNNLKLFENANINVDIEAFKKLSIKEQSAKLKEYFNQLGNHYDRINIKIPYESPLKTIYHEMGHLQDFATNQKELHLSYWDSWNPLKVFKQIFSDAKKGIKNSKTDISEKIDDRWGGLTYKQWNGVSYKDLLVNDPDRFKEMYPKLYEFVTNDEIQQTAGRVSEYATTSIGEFIAETYAKLVQGKKLPDDVMALYKKYGGPAI